MAREVETEFVGEVALKDFDGFEIKLDDRAAHRTDEVIVVLPLEGALVSCPFTSRNQSHLQ